MSRPVIAIMYDFDNTLCTKDMQEYAFIPSIGMEADEFWRAANGFGREIRMDAILAYMYTMVVKSREKGIPFSRQSLVEKGRGIELFPGVTDWFSRVNRCGDELGVSVEHYVISSGLKEIIEGCPISREFREIYASEFFYDESGAAVWPKLSVNFTNKTQFVYRINKGVLDISNDRDLNASMPDDSKRVPFDNMIYIGDGLSDVPCMKMMQAYGGVSIAVYKTMTQDVQELLQKGRVDFIYPADYREGSGLDGCIRDVLRRMAIADKLSNEKQEQMRSIK